MTDHLPPPPSAPGGGWSAVGPYATSSMPMPTIRSLAGLATALTVLLALVALVELWTAQALLRRAGLFDDAANGILVGFEEGTDADDRVRAGLLGHFFGFVAIAVVFITWQFRHAKNAEVLGARGGLGPGWAIGGWFVPLGNYVLPAVQLHQSSRASDLEGRQAGRGRGSGLVVLWAILFAMASLTFLVGSGQAPTDEEIGRSTVEYFEAAGSSDRTEGIGMGMYAIAAVAAILMVRSLSAKQSEAYAAMATATTTALASSPNAPGAAWGATSQGWSMPAPPPPPPPVPPTTPSPPGAPLPPQ